MKHFAAVLAVLCTLVTGAQATVVNYNTAVAFPHVESGYTTTAGSGTANFFGCLPPCANNGTPNVFSFNANITVAGLPPFKLTSFEGGELFQGLPAFWASSILVTGNLFGGGTVTQTFAIDGIHDGPGVAIDYQVFTLGASFTNLTSVVFSGVAGAFGAGVGFTLDNVNVNASSVPEPGTLALLGLAFASAAAVGSKTRRRRAA